MKVTPVTSPHQVAPVQSNATQLRAQAIAKFNAAAAEPQPEAHAQQAQSPVLDQNNIGVEELGAIQAKSVPEVDNSAPTEAQEDTQAPETPKEDPALSRQFAQLARQERQLRLKAQQQDQALKAREAALAAREAALTSTPATDLTQYIPRERLKQDALSVLDEAGVSYDELTQQIINRQPTDPRVSATISRLEAKIAQLEKAGEESTKAQADNQTRAYQSAVKQIEVDARNLVKSDPNFETIKATNSIKDIVELITETYDKDGILMSVEEAAQEVENYLVEEAMKLTRIDKIKRQIAQSSATTTQSTVSQPKQTQPQMKTLTNATASTRKLSARERALLAFKGELKG